MSQTLTNPTIQQGRADEWLLDQERGAKWLPGRTTAMATSATGSMHVPVHSPYVVGSPPKPPNRKMWAIIRIRGLDKRALL